jgi:addiction module HigA family antidote
MLHCRFKEQEREEFELLGPPHPGEILREEVLPRLTISRKSLAVQLGISYSGVSRLLRERRRITGGLAARLAAISGTSALYWLVLQAHHDAWVLQGATRPRPTDLHVKRRDDCKLVAGHALFP